MTRPRYMTCWMQQNMALQCLFDSTMREVSNTNIALKYLPLKAIGKKLGKEEA